MFWFSFIILKQRDAVALGIFDEDMKDYAPRSDSRASLHDIIYCFLDPRIEIN